MQFTLILLVLTISVSCAFVPQRFNRHKLNILRLNEQKYDIVPVGKYSIIVTLLLLLLLKECPAISPFIL